MSEMAKAARAAMKAKAKKMSSGEPHEKVDASSWSPPKMMNTGAKTGMRPLTKRAYKKGGKVVGYCEGGEAKKHAGRKPRKAGGRTMISDLINRNAKKANDYREGGDAHVGALKRGGRAHKLYGGSFVPRGTAPSNPRGAAGSVFGAMKKGGKVHEDIAADKKLIKKALRQHDEHMHGGKHEDIKLKKGGRTHKQYGGSDGKYGGSDGKYGSIDELMRAKGIDPYAPRRDGKYGNIDELMRAKGIGPYAPRRETAPRDDDMTNPFTGEPRTGRKKGGRTHKQYGGSDGDVLASAVNKADAQNSPYRANRLRAQDFDTPERKEYDARMNRMGRASYAADSQDLDAQNAINRSNRKRGGKTSGTYFGGTRPTGGRMPRAKGGSTYASADDNPNLRLVKTHMGENGHSTKVYKDKDWGEYRVKHFINGEPQSKADYHTDDADDAHSTAQAMMRSARATGGRAKGKTNIVIAINPQHAAHGMMQPSGMPPQGPTPRPGGAAPVAPPTAPMPMLPGMGNLPPGAMPPGGGMPGAGMMPPGLMPRKAGGRVYRSYEDMDAGSGSGLGRLEKTQIQRRK